MERKGKGEVRKGLGKTDTRWYFTKMAPALQENMAQVGGPSGTILTWRAHLGEGKERDVPVGFLPSPVFPEEGGDSQGCQDTRRCPGSWPLHEEVTTAHTQGQTRLRKPRRAAKWVGKRPRSGMLSEEMTFPLKLEK